MKLLVVEDEHLLRESIVSNLQSTGCVVEGVGNCFDAEDRLLSHSYDVVILDITLPDGSGLDILKKLKELSPESGVLILSAKGSLDDKLEGLDLGADDYLTKPFHFAELNARIQALIRRRKFHGDHKVKFNEIEIDTTRMIVMVNKQSLELTRKEYELLLYFITNKERVVARQAIAEHLWGDHVGMADNYDFLYTHIKNLRKKIENAGGKDYVQSVYGVGYKFTSK